MNKGIIVAIAALVVSIGAGTGARLALGPHPPAPPVEPAEGNHEASVAAGEGAGAESHPAEAAKPIQAGLGGGGESMEEDVLATHRPESLADGGGSGDASEVVSGPPAGMPHGAKSEGRGEPLPEMSELGRAIQRMPAGDAALLMRYLDDRQVIAVIRSMTLGEALQVLEAMPPDRAASLRRELFQGGGH